MQTRKLGTSNIQVSSIGVGTWALGGPYWTEGEPTGWSGKINKSEAIEAIHYAIENGVTHFDTADVYGYGKSERILGEAIKGYRNQLTVATKVGFAATTAKHVFDPVNIRKQCEQSLRNLGLDVIDLYYFHHCDFGDQQEYLDDAVQMMNILKDEGKIRFVGISEYSFESIEAVIDKINPIVIQSWADIEHDEFIRQGAPLRKLMDERDIKFIAMMPLGQGRLLGKYKPDKPPVFGEGDNRIDNDAFSEISLRELEPRLNKIKVRFGADICDLSRVALQFLLFQDVVCSVIPGFRSMKHMKCNLKGANQPLTRDDIEYILNVFPRDEMRPHPWE